MKSLTRSLIALAVVLALTPNRSHAQNLPTPPGQISYQGYVTDANGFPLATNNPVNYTVNFGIWDSPQGGSNVWLEQQVVTIDRGYFTVLLGNGSSIGGFYTNNLTSIFSGTNAGNRYLELTVLGLAPGDPPIAPRLRFLASPYALLASQATSVSGTNTVPDNSLSPNVALRNGGNNFGGLQYFVQPGGGMFFDNTYELLAKNTSGTYESFLYPRYSDNVTYLDYGANGFQIRRNAGTVNAIFASSLGFLGIGGFSQTVPPTAPLSFVDAKGDKISLWDSGGGVGFGFGIQANQLQIHTDSSLSDVVFGYGSSTNSTSLTEVMRIRGNGNVGIGTPTPGFPLNFQSILGDKISLYGNSGNHFGFGIQGALLQIHADVAASDIAFGYGQSASFNEVMRIKGNGTVGIGTTHPVQPFQVGDSGVPGSVGMIHLASRGPTGGAARDWDIGVPQNTSAVGIGYSFVIHDSDLSYPAQFLVQYQSGNVAIGNTNAPYLLTVGPSASPAYCNGTTWVNGSDRNIKESFSEINPANVLEKVVALPINEWKYKAEANGARHLGPVAQDFHAAFGLNGEDDKHISTVDEGGVALAAIQGLNQKLENKEAEITELKQRLDKLEHLLELKANDQAR